MRLVIVGPPGAGKGTQAAKLSAALELPSISTGAAFRESITSGTELGDLIASYIDNGNLVPDEVTDKLVAHYLEQKGSEGFLLDGYPRTVSQVESLDRLLAAQGAQLDAVIQLQIPDPEIVARLLRRASVENRRDDTEEVIRHRIEVYHQNTEPLLAVYRERGLLVGIDGMGTIDEVHERLTKATREFLGI